MNEELTAFIIKELGKHRDRNEIIRKVCGQSGLNWRDAEQLLGLVEAQHRRAIAGRQSPPLLFISIGTLFLGIGLLAFNLHLLSAFFHKDALAQLLSMPGSDYQVLGLIMGLGMTTGGMVGLWNAFGSIFPE